MVSEAVSEEHSHLAWAVWAVWVEVDSYLGSEVDSLPVSEVDSEAVEVDSVDHPAALAVIITVAQLPWPEDETLAKTSTPTTVVRKVLPPDHPQGVRP